MATRQKIQQRLKEIRAGDVSGISDNKEAIRKRLQEIRQQPQEPQEGVLGGFAKGVGKGFLSTIKGAATLGEKIVGAPTRALQELTGQEVTEPTSALQLQQQAEQRLGLKAGILTTPTTGAQKAGFFAEQVGEFLAPGGAALKVGKVAQAAVTGGKLARGAARFAPQIATDVGVTAAQTGGDIQQSLITGGVSAAFPLAGGLLGRAIGRPILSFLERIPKRLTQSVLKQSKAELRAGKDVSEFVLKKKKAGTPEKMFEAASAEVKSLSEQIERGLRSIPVTAKKITTKNILLQVVKELNEGGAAITMREVRDIIERLAPLSKGALKKPSMGVLTANKLRQSLDATLGDRAFLATQIPQNKQVLKKFNDILREQVKTKGPEGTRELFEILSKEITLRDALEGIAISKARNFPISFADVITLLGVGTVTGGPVGAAVGLAVKRAAQSPRVLLQTAQLLNRIPDLKPIFEKLSLPQRALLLELIQGTPLEE